MFLYTYTKIYPIFIIVLALIFYFRHSDFHLSLQKNVRMQPSHRLLVSPQYFPASFLLAWRLLKLWFLE